MSRHNRDPPTDIPEDWSPEPMPEQEREWLTESFVAYPLGVTVSILLADPLSDREEPVYPVAITTSANKAVYQREYSVCTVAETLTDARQVATRLMHRLSDEFASGTQPFIEHAVDGVIGSTRPHVDTASPA